MEIKYIDQLINELIEIKSKHGNLPLYYTLEDTDAEYAPLTVEVKEAGTQINFLCEEEELPKRLVFG